MNAEIADEFASYEEQIKKYCRGEMDETRMQKYRLHFGTYAQRQEGVQMQRIKIPGGFLISDQLVELRMPRSDMAAASCTSPPVKMHRYITFSSSRCQNFCGF
jgi:sulfite reductase beta subunit-like hemoprotein